MSEEAKSRGRKVYRAKSFALSIMSCPSCHLTLDAPVDRCPRCQFTGEVSRSRFPFAAPPMGRFIDPQNHLSESERERISKALNDLAKKFPQPRICFCIIDLDEGVDLREFGFWMMNASPVDSPDEAELRPWTILVVIDDINGNVSVTPGYAIEPFLDDQRWCNHIRQERQYFFARDYGTAALKVIEGAEAILRDGAKRVERKMDKNRSAKKRLKRKVKNSE